MKSRTVISCSGPAGLLDGGLAAAIVLARRLIPVVAFGLVLYLVLRPFLPGLAGEAASRAVSWRDLGTWPRLLVNTAVVVGVASAVDLAIGLPLGFALFRTDLPGRHWLTWLLLLPACLPVYVGATAILACVGVRPWDGNAWMAGVIHGWLGLPWAALQCGLAYRHVDGTLEEAAALDTGWARVYFALDLRLILWSLLSVVMLQVWLAGSEVAVTDLLAVRTFAEEVYVSFQLNRSLHAQTLVVIPYAVLFILLTLSLSRAARSADTPYLRYDDRPARIVCLGRRRWLVALGVTVVFGLLGVVPLAQLLREVGTLSQFVAWGRAMRGELANSALLALGGAAGVTVVVLVVGEWAAEPGPGPRRLRAALILLLAVPTPCLAIALKELLNRPGPLAAVHDSLALPILGQSLRWLPFAVLAAAPGWLLITRELRDAARVEGCGLGRLHRCVYWPAAARFIALAACVVGVLILGELTANVVLAPPGCLPLSVRFFTLAHYGLKGQASAVCLLTALVMVIPWAILVQLLHRPR